jgi:class 3 adenylate cyclase
MQEVAIRKGMYRTAETAFDRSGVSWADCHVEDRGDGLMILVSASVPKSRLASHTLAQLIAALTEHNQAHDAAEQIELRLAIHAGEVLYDEHGVAGRAVTHTSRLLVLQRHMG